MANTEDLEAIAAFDAPDLAALKGWRYEIFGKDALALKSGRVALAVEKGRVALVERKPPKKRKHGS